METPVLSKTQQRKSLSARKAPKATIKSVLATPYHAYWPCLSAEDAETLAGALRSRLPRIGRARTNVPWKEIKDLPREKRKEFRREYAKRSGDESASQSKDPVIFGVNEATKLLEEDALDFLLVAADVTPRLLVKHLLDMSARKEIPALVVPGLREILRERVGFASVAVAVKSPSSDPDLAALKESVRSVSCGYPPPDYFAKIRREGGGEGEAGNAMETEAEAEVFLGDVLLRRNDRSERVFVPELSVGAPEKSQSGAGSGSGFLPLEDGAAPAQALIPLVVKRIRGNKDRNRRKIAKLKGGVKKN